MDTIVSPFIKQFEIIKDECLHKSKIVIGTMGPETTSSVQAAKYFCNNIGNGIQYEFKLYPDFVHVLDFMRKEESLDFALVPSAYERITDFFWDIKLENCMSFIFPTPKYGLVCLDNHEINFSDRVTIATCHAVEHIIGELSNGIIDENKVTKIITPSTTTALEEVINGHADLAITNQTSFDYYKDKGIRFIFNQYNTNIVWCLFRKRGQK